MLVLADLMYHTSIPGLDPGAVVHFLNHLGTPRSREECSSGWCSSRFNSAVFHHWSSPSIFGGCPTLHTSRMSTFISSGPTVGWYHTSRWCINLFQMLAMMDSFNVCLSEPLSIEKCFVSGIALACPPTRWSKCLHDRWALKVPKSQYTRSL